MRTADRPLRLIFMGSPEFALPSLEAVIAVGHELSLVVSQPDRPAGRRRLPTPPPVAERASRAGLPLYQPSRLRQPDDLRPLVEARPDLIVVVAYGMLLPQAVLDLAPHGCLNVHPSLLPRWRGAAPIQAAVLAGDARTGVTVMRLEQRMDAGPIVAQEAVDFLPPGTDSTFASAWRGTALPPPEEDARQLERRLGQVGARLLVQSIDPWVAGKLVARPQDDNAATYCGRFSRSDAALDWRKPASELARQVRAFRGRGDAFTTWDGRILKILAAREVDEHRDPAPPGTVLRAPSELGRSPLVATGRGLLALYGLALEGRPAVDAPAFLNGQPRFVGARLGLAHGPEA